MGRKAYKKIHLTKTESDVIDKIANVSTDPYDCPLEDISIISVIRIEK